MKKSIIDKYLNKLISRKLIVFIVSAIGLFTGFLTSSDFVLIGAIYIGTQGVYDLVISYKNGNNGGAMYE